MTDESPQERGVKNIDLIKLLSAIALHMHSAAPRKRVSDSFNLPPANVLAKATNQSRPGVLLLYGKLIESGAVYTNGAGSGKVYRARSFDMFMKSLHSIYISQNSRVYISCMIAPNSKMRGPEAEKLFRDVVRKLGLQEEVLLGLFSGASTSRVDYDKSIQAFVKSLESAKLLIKTLGLIPTGASAVLCLKQESVEWNKKKFTKEAKDSSIYNPVHEVSLIVPKHFDHMFSSSLCDEDGIYKLDFLINDLELYGVPHGIEQIEQNQVASKMEESK